MTSDFQDILYLELKNKIKEVRKDMNLTQFDFAEKLGLSRASIVNIEKGRQKPTIHLLYEISLLAGIDMNYFFESIPNKDSIPTLSKRVEKKLEKELLDDSSKSALIKIISTIDKNDK